MSGLGYDRTQDISLESFQSGMRQIMVCLLMCVRVNACACVCVRASACACARVLVLHLPMQCRSLSRQPQRFTISDKSVSGALAAISKDRCPSRARAVLSTQPNLFPAQIHFPLKFISRSNSFLTRPPAAPSVPSPKKRCKKPCPPPNSRFSRRTPPFSRHTKRSSPKLGLQTRL
jgi:hypothetical protein